MESSHVRDSAGAFIDGPIGEWIANVLIITIKRVKSKQRSCSLQTCRKSLWRSVTKIVKSTTSFHLNCNSSIEEGEKNVCFSFAWLANNFSLEVIILKRVDGSTIDPPLPGLNLNMHWTWSWSLLRGKTQLFVPQAGSLNKRYVTTNVTNTLPLCKRIKTCDAGKLVTWHVFL